MRSQTDSCGEQQGSTLAAPAPGAQRAAWWLDMLLMVALFGAALLVREVATRGDLWFDEADYAFAAVRGFAANRWDASDVPSEPERLLRFRHYHPPFIAYMVGLALHGGPEDRTLRVPSVLAGGLTVVLVYLCGLALFRPGTPLASSLLHPSRLVALACTVIVIFTPPHIRASSHALPWSFITLWLMLLLWTLLGYVGTRQEGWLVGAGAALGGLFVTSEYFFPALMASVCLAPFLFWPTPPAPPCEGGDRRGALRRRKRLLLALAAGIGVFLGLGLVLWPAGLRGGAFQMLRHYVEMADKPYFSVTLGGQRYVRAPKWAYLYWYWQEYRPLLLCYAFGMLAALTLLLRRRLTAGAGVLLVFTGVILLSAHKAHIIGPEYLAHALPPLTLVGGLFFLTVSRVNRPLGLAIMAAACLAVILQLGAYFLTGKYTRVQVSRWPAAARFLAGRWQPNDRMLAPQYGTVGRWYLLHVAGVPAQEWQVQALPAEKASDRLLQEIVSGVYRYIAVGSTFSDQPGLDPRIQQILQTWPVVWQSDEGGTGPSRLVIYQLPRGVTHRTPLPLPPE